jgi:hypothetical protein
MCAHSIRAEERNVTCDDKIALAFAIGIFSLPAYVVVFLLWEGWGADALRRAWVHIRPTRRR